MQRILRLRSETPARSLRLYFNYPRGEIRRVGPRELPRELESTEVRRHNNAFEISWKGVLEAKAMLEVGVDYQGEVPSLVRAEFVPEGVETMDSDALERFPSEEEALSQRHGLVEALSSAAMHSEQRFFLDLDCQTRFKASVREVCGLPPLPHAKEFGYFQSSLRSRVIDRSHENKLSDVQEEDLIEPYSTLIVALLRKHFGLDFIDVQEKLDRAERAFERFANAELILAGADRPDPLLDAQPASANYLLFAEFAFVAHTHTSVPPAHQDVWTKMLNVLVRTQEVYAKAYSPTTPFNTLADDKKLAWKNYNVNNLWVDGATSSRFALQDLDQLRTTYRATFGDEPAKLEKRMGKNLMQVLADEP